MNNVATAYNELSKKKIPSVSLINLFNEIDTEICKNLIEQGYSSEAVEDIIMSRSYGFKTTAPELMKEYLITKIPQNHIGFPQQLPIGDAYEKAKEAYAAKFQELLLDVDAEIICDLKEHQYSMKNILEAVSKFSPIKNFVCDASFIAKYKSAVIERSNSAHFRRIYKSVEKASRLYSHLQHHQVGKHKGYTMDNVSHVREGSIVVSMMMEHGVPIDIIGKVLEKNSPIAKLEGDDYVAKIMQRLTSIKAAYARIANANASDAEDDVSQLYYEAAREYMKSSDTKVLCARDDEHILGELMKRNLNREQIVTLLACSPVALEIGRNLHDYVKNLSDYFNANYEDIRTMSMAEVKEKAQERLEYYGRYFNLDNAEKTAKQDSLLIHSLICKDLLSSECNPELIAPVMEEMVSDIDDRKGYVAELLYKASEAVKAEQNIKNFRNRNFSQELKLTPNELFMIVAKDKIRDNPSFIRRWSYSSELDADIMETVFVKYPDTDLEKLRKALMAISPKALMAEDREAYAQEVMGKLSRRRELNKIGQKIIEAKQKEYTRQCGIAVEGTFKENYMDSYVDGKVAIKLLQSGKPPLEVRNAILMASEPKGVSPGEYADRIIERALKVTDRLKAIAAHIPAKAVLGAAVGLSAIYLDYLSNQYEMKGFIHSKMDIDAFYMMQQKGAKPEEIKEVIKEYSPVYMEPGRNEEYLDYVESNANEKLLEEQQKLEYYKAVARENHEDYLNEYAKHQRDLQKNIDLAYSAAMDEIIAEAMMIQGFSDDEISKALDKSPVRFDDNYANKIIEKAKDRMQDHEYVTKEKVTDIAPVTSVNEKVTEHGNVMTRETSVITKRSKQMIRERTRINETDG